MPKRSDINSILIVGSGPIIIGQACEFDYSGTQACKALREEGYRVVLVNSNPATIMTDPEMADATYIEPITPESVRRIIKKERPDAILPTLGGQTALNIGMSLSENGTLEEFGVEMIGANAEVINRAEDRDEFAEVTRKCGLGMAKADIVNSWEDALKVKEKIGLPLMIRPSFTMGGTGGGFCETDEEYETICKRGLMLSRINEISIEESLLGWKEYELEVMRDKNDNVVIICSIENFDPMGVHTGDSITIAPAQTLSDREYQRMRDAALDIIREVGVETGGSNIQFATNPEDGRLIVIEMNPRVSRSSALASKATGFPIAKFAAKLAVGYTLDELRNDITKATPACFEPTIDYVVTKIPRFTFEKFPEADDTLGYQMKSVGEIMAIGRTFKESFQKALRGMETGAIGFGDGIIPENLDKKNLLKTISRPTAERCLLLRDTILSGATEKEIFDSTAIDPWFIRHLTSIVEHEHELREKSLDTISIDEFKSAKRDGFSDAQLAAIWNTKEITVRENRYEKKIHPVFKLVDTCAAEFAAITPYYYSSYEDECEARVSDKRKIMILGGGPNRIGQGIEFDYCCCHAAMALRDAGIETIMVNSNPETVSTDYDTSDYLFFESLTTEDVLEINKVMNPDGVIVQFGGQTPLNLSVALEEAGVKIIGTSPEDINRAGDREIFKQTLEDLNLLQPSNGIARSDEEALEQADRVGYPVVVRPSFVLGGRAMEIVYTKTDLARYMKNAVQASPNAPVLIDKFLENATEIDVDCLSDGTDFVIGGMLEHIEEAGIHSGDSACVIPCYSLSKRLINKMREVTFALAKAFNVRGLMNIQYAIRHEEVFLIEVNPRASRTVPFVSKATGLPLAKIAALVQSGKTLKELGVTEEVLPVNFSVKESVLPFNKFPGTDTVLGPEMKSTGEVMGVAPTLGEAFYKAQLAAGNELKTKGSVFISVKDNDKRIAISIAREIEELGFQVVSTNGSGEVFKRNGVNVKFVDKVSKNKENNVMTELDNIAIVLNTPSHKGAKFDEAQIRSACAVKGIPYFTTIESANVLISALKQEAKETYKVRPLQEILPKIELNLK